MISLVSLSIDSVMLCSIMGYLGDFSSFSSLTFPSPLLLSMLTNFSLLAYTPILRSRASCCIWVLCISLSLSSMLVMNLIFSSTDSILILSPLGKSKSRSYSMSVRSRISKSSCNSSSLLSYFSSNDKS